MDELNQEQKAKLDSEAQQKLRFMEQQYWRLRNGKSRFMLCPYCSPVDQKFKRRNWPNTNAFCCHTFARALKAILDRQDEVNKAMKAAKTVMRLSDLTGQVNGN